LIFQKFEILTDSKFSMINICYLANVLVLNKCGFAMSVIIHQHFKSHGNQLNRNNSEEETANNESLLKLSTNRFQHPNV